MALSYDQITAITKKKFIPKMVDNIFDSNPLLKRLRAKSPKVDGGERIMVPLNYAVHSSAGWFSGADTLNVSDNDSITAAEYTWKQAFSNITITRLDELKNSGESQVLNFVKQKVMISEKTLADTLGTGIYNDGTTAKALVGLRAIVDAGSTVGGIAQGTYSWWQAQEDTSTTTMTISALQSQFTAASIDNDTPTVIMMTRANFDRYYNLLQPQQRFMDAETAKGGFSSLMFNGKPVIADSYCPANHVFMLNENYLDLYVHRDEDFRFEPFIKVKDQAVKVAKIYFAGALASSNNRMHAKFDSLTA
jgi:hypothetical protein